MVNDSIFRAGDICGQSYRIVRPVMRNAWIEKYLVKHKDTGNTAILTCSRFRHVPGDPPSPELFRANAERIRSAPFVEMPKVYDFGIQDGVYWIAVQYIHAPNVLMAGKERSNTSPEWRVLDAVSMAGVLSSMLGDLEKCGLRHGHLTPEHVLIDGMPFDMNVFLLDAGFADLFQFNEVAARHYLRYCAPEVFKGNSADGRADIYSLGMILYHLIAQHPPYWDKNKVDSDGALISMVLDEHPTDLRENAYCPDDLWDLILGAIQKDPDKRFQSVREFYEHVQLVLDRIEEEPRVTQLAEAVRAEAEANNTALVPLLVRKETNEGHEPKTEPRGPGSELKKRAAWLHALQHATLPKIGKQETPPGDELPSPQSSPRAEPTQADAQDAQVKTVSAPIEVIAEVSAKAKPEEVPQGPTTSRSASGAQQGTENEAQASKALSDATPEQKPVSGRPWLGKVWRATALASVVGGALFGAAYFVLPRRSESLQTLDLARPIVSIEINAGEPEKAPVRASPTCMAVPIEPCATCTLPSTAPEAEAKKSDRSKDTRDAREPELNKKASPRHDCPLGAIFCIVPR